jgi:hypothetical protein
MDDRKIQISVSCGDDISINFKLNVSPVLLLVSVYNPNPNPTRYYGELFIHHKSAHDASPILVKSYDFANFTQIFPVLKKIAATNFIESIQHVISMLQFILHNNQNPWLRLEKTSDATPPTPPTPYYVNLKTNESFWELPAGIHPWTTYVNEDGRTYYVNSSMNETSWLNPVEQQGTHLNVVLNQIIECLQNGKTQSDLKSEIVKTLSIRQQEQEEAKKAAEEAKKVEAEQRRLAARTQMMNMKIDIVFVICGHSICGRKRMGLKDPNMIVVTLSKLYDSLVGTDNVMYDNGSGIIKAFESSQPDLPTVSSIVDIAVELRSKKLVYPKKVQEGSIRVRRGRSGRSGRSGSESNNTLTEQFFYGGTKHKKFSEGVFMYSKDGVVDISSLERLLTPTGKKNLYEETTDFQKRIIDFESKHPDESTDLDLERQFAAESKVAFDAEEFKTEWENLQLQRRLFCNSLNFIDSIESCVMSCKGIDVMVLQKYYDSIVEWEKRNRKSAFEYFKEDKERIKEFMEEFGLDQNDKKIEGLLMMLSDKRKQQLIKQSEVASEILGRKVEPLELIENDFQLVPSLYQQESCIDILRKINSISKYHGKTKLFFLEGCRDVVDEDGNKVKGTPDDSEHEVEDYNEDLGGARQNYKINRKNTNKKNKNAHSKKKKNVNSKKKKNVNSKKKKNVNSKKKKNVNSKKKKK